LAVEARGFGAVTTPDWSVVIPTRDRPKSLALCIAALLRLEPPTGGFEIVVVNDGGVEPPSALRSLAESGGVVIHFLTQSNTGPAGARNLGARVAKGRLLAFTDDDCQPDPGWLRALDRALAAHPAALAGGCVVNALDTNVLSETSQRLANFVARWFDGSGGERFFTSNNLAVSRCAFLEFGGFEPSLRAAAAEDREFCDRWSAESRPSIGVEEAVVRHSHALSVAGFLRQHYGYGRGARQFRRLRSRAGRRVRIEPAFYSASLRHAALGSPPGRGLALAVCTMVAHGAYLTGLARECLIKTNS
jgi:glycosyltransferase involved in cell wall biosynthesis